jgi:hypothetical protein
MGIEISALNMSPESQHAYKRDHARAAYDAYISDYRQAVAWKRRFWVCVWVAASVIGLLVGFFLLR